jgi:hypothetical protein
MLAGAGLSRAWPHEEGVDPAGPRKSLSSLITTTASTAPPRTSTSMCDATLMSLPFSSHIATEASRRAHAVRSGGYQPANWPFVAQKAASPVRTARPAAAASRRRPGRPADQRRPTTASLRASPVTM